VELTALELKALVDEETSVSAAVALSKPEAGLLLSLWRHGDVSVSCYQHIAVIQEKDGDKDAGRWAPLWDAG